MFESIESQNALLAASFLLLGVVIIMMALLGIMISRSRSNPAQPPVIRVVQPPPAPTVSRLTKFRRWLAARRLRRQNRLAVVVTPTTPAYSPKWYEVLNALKSKESLVVGAIVDLAIGFIIANLIGLGVYVPLGAKIGIAILIAVPKYIWSTNFYRKYTAHPEKNGNYVSPFELGILTFLGEIVPSGPDGKGLGAGYHWFLLGDPFFAILEKVSVKEIPIPFNNMQVWTKNSPVSGQGALEGLTDGLAQFRIVDPTKFNAVTDPTTVLEAIVLECARDICETETMEQFINTKNDDLAKRIYERINQTLAARDSDLGLQLVSVNVKKTDNKDAPSKAAWSAINSAASLNTARATEAAGRVQRIKDYKDAGVDANRAAALDAVATGHAGATIGDQRFHLDVGSTVEDLTRLAINKIGGTRP